MAQSNRQAVENNQIDPDERLDLTVPRNGSLTLEVYLTETDDDGVETPIDLTGQDIFGGVKTSYEAAQLAFAPDISDRDDENGYFKATYSAATARGLGIGVVDCVHDMMRAPSGGGDPTRIWAGLLELSKGVAVSG